MPLDATPRDTYSSTKHTARSAARIQIDFILANTKHLAKVDPKGRCLTAVKAFDVLMRAGEDLSPNKLSYLENIYEKVWKGYGEESAGLHVDKKKRTLKFG